MILAGDIGGTHTRLAFFEDGALVLKKVFKSSQYHSLDEIVEEFISEKKVTKACFGVAGPVRENKAKITNLSWTVDGASIQSFLKAPVHILNDLESNAYGIEVLEEKDFFILHKGKEIPGNQGLISAGTGLGEAGLFWDGKKHHPFACEGGHVSFSPMNEEEVHLLFYLQKKFGHVSYERLVSGPGLCQIYEFLTETGREKEKEPLLKKEDPAKAISERGLKGDDLASKKALDWFLSIYGAKAGNVALQFLALGGIYIGGGIAPHLLEKFKEGFFYESFINKGRFKALLEAIPIRIILNDDAALLGAGNYAEKYL